MKKKLGYTLIKTSYNTYITISYLEYRLLNYKALFSRRKLNVITKND